MVRADVAEVAAIEAQTFVLSWNAEGFERFLAEPGRFAFVAVDAHDAVAGYAAVDIDWRTAHLMNFAVREDARGKGVGTRLLRECVRAVRARGARRMYLEVRESNGAAQAFYRSFGFDVRGKRRAYYRDNLEDARVMALRFDEGGEKCRK